MVMIRVLVRSVSARGPVRVRCDGIVLRDRSESGLWATRENEGIREPPTEFRFLRNFFCRFS